MTVDLTAPLLWAIIFGVLVVVQFFRSAIRYQKLTRALILSSMSAQWKDQLDIIHESGGVLDGPTTTVILEDLVTKGLLDCSNHGPDKRPLYRMRAP